MKIQIFILLTIMLFCGVLTAQTNKEWKPVLISMDGSNGFAGVEATYMLEKCNSVDVVLLKLKNTNNYAVKTQWINSVVTKDGKDLFGTNSKISRIRIGANGEGAGDCSGNTVELTIKLSDFGILLNNFETFVGSNFFAAKD